MTWNDARSFATNATASEASEPVRPLRASPLVHHSPPLRRLSPLALPALDRPGVPPAQRVVPRRDTQRALAKKRVRVRGVRPDAVQARHPYRLADAPGMVCIRLLPKPRKPRLGSPRTNARTRARASGAARAAPGSPPEPPRRRRRNRRRRADRLALRRRLPAERNRRRRGGRRREQAPQHAVHLHARRAIEHHARHEHLPLVRPEDLLQKPERRPGGGDHRRSIRAAAWACSSSLKSLMVHVVVRRRHTHGTPRRARPRRLAALAHGIRAHRVVQLRRPERGAKHVRSLVQPALIRARQAHARPAV